ncbi:M20 aminoacylase family protein [Falsirhodobacter algicola]|uniref:Amidohydrolase n=1 Tax=Falsirhodobacter algicola TaxID=2692330 RepID=A0A8J8SKS9_9RHOB|nr:M20 aminoacylase family protein [Falsirhodobacter algicola]QUS35698.1 amidohydrolase [Falsirhodobacter algicola]
MPVKNRLAEMVPEITAWRRDFHAHPELKYEEHRTAARVAELLRSFGVDEVHEGIGRTGVVGVIRGRPGDRVIGLRADMDALPILEKTGKPHASTIPGVMHACGHDGHTAMLLGAAKYLAETRAFNGTAVMVFQPAEEGGGGAKAMIDDGLFARWGIQEMYGLHTRPGLPLGSYATRTGPLLAAADTFRIFVTGKGGHAARPHECVDPMLAAAQIVVALQGIVARNVNPLRAAVLSVCTCQTDSPATNVIPQQVMLGGTVRTMDPALRDVMQTRLTSIATSVAEALGATAEVVYERGYPVTVNDAFAVEHAVDVAAAIAGPDAVNAQMEPMMGAEDFSYYGEQVPAAFIFLGNGDSAGVHSAEFDFDDDAIAYGSGWLVGMVEARAA